MFHRAVFQSSRIAMSLRLRGFKKTKEALHRKLPSALLQQLPSDEHTRDTVRKACRMVKASARHGIVRPTCLVESLTLWYLLQKQSIPTTLRIGVRKVSQKFEAHAWVEYEGVALNQHDEQHRHYAAFDSGFSGLPGDKP